MDLVKTFFKIPKPLPKPTSNESMSSILIIEEQIKQLESMNLSLPSTKEDLQIHKKDSSTIIKKIIYHFDIILMDQLKNSNEKLSRAGSNLSEEVHYWNYLSKYFQISSVKFINNIYEKIQTIPEKGLAWIYISISEKSFHESLNEIYTQGFDNKFYNDNSLIYTRKKEILQISEKISKFELIKKSLEIEEEYLIYRKQKEKDGKYLDANEIELSMVSPLSSNRKSGNSYVMTPYALDSYCRFLFLYFLVNKNEKIPNNNFYNSKATLDIPMYNLHSTADNVKTTKTIENIFNLMNYGDDENNLMNTVSNPDLGNDEDDFDVIREKNYPRNTQVIYSKVNNNSNEDKVLSTLKIMARTMNNKENYNVSKYFDIQSYFKEDYFSLILDNKKDDVITASKNVGIHTNANAIISINNNPISHNLNQNQDEKSKFFIPFDKNFKICLKLDKTQFTKKDIIYYKNKEIKMTNSVVYYLNHFYKKEHYIRFKTKISNTKPKTLSMQNNQCQFCKKMFTSFLFFPTKKVFWCSYYMCYICEDCLSNEYSIIPAFILKFWNFKKFSISKNAKELLEKWHDKPVIHIKHSDSIISQSTLLHTAIIIKKKIHKIFDLMKCENAETFALSTLGNYKYLVLRETLFSLKDLVEISEFKMLIKLEEFLKKFEDHILKDCEACNYKGGNCVMCGNEEILYAYDLTKVFYCVKCKQLYHKKCCSFHPCIINQ